MIKIIKNCFTAILLSVFSCSALAGGDMFIKIDGIKGESFDSNHKDEIDLLAWSWGASTEISGKRSSCNIQDLSLTKYVDAASPMLLMGQLDGTTYQSARLVVRKSGYAGEMSSLEYIVIEFNDVRITSLSTGGSEGEDRLTENVTFNFSNATYTYTTQTEQGGKGNQIVATIGGC